MHFTGRVLLVGPLAGARWRSISAYTSTLAEALRANGVDVAVAAAPWWNPPSILAGLRQRWTRETAIQSALRGEFDVVHLTDHALAHHVARFAPHARVVVTCHDVMPFTVPGYYNNRLEGIVKRGFLRRPINAIRRAHAVIAVSDYTAGQLQSVAGVPPDRISVIPNIVRPVFRPRERQECEAALADRGITLPPAPRLLSVGHAGGYKNVPLVLHALAQPALADWNLVRVGGLTRSQQALARQLGVESRIVQLRGVDDEVLAALYGACDALIQPSLAEGFGMPVIEAMACGLPVVTSDGGALPEVVGDAGAVVPLNPPDGLPNRFAEALASALDPATARKSQSRGLERATDFSPTAVIPSLLDVYSGTGVRDRGLGHG